MAGQVVEHHHIARLECRQENLLDVSQEERTIQCAIDDHRRGEFIVSQRGDESSRLPMAVWCIVHYPLSTAGSTIHPNEIGLQARFINEDQLFSGHTGAFGAPVSTPQLYVRPLLLTGMQDFF